MREKATNSAYCRGIQTSATIQPDPFRQGRSNLSFKLTLVVLYLTKLSFNTTLAQGQLSEILHFVAEKYLYTFGFYYYVISHYSFHNRKEVSTAPYRNLMLLTCSERHLLYLKIFFENLPKLYLCHRKGAILESIV